MISTFSCPDKPIDDFIDLTQEFETSDLNEPTPKTELPESGSSGDILLNYSSQEASCPISKELFLKYARVDTFPIWKAEEDEDKDDFGFSSEPELKSSEQSSFHLDIITTQNDSKLSSSFSEMNFSRNSMRRSVSLSTDQSFKSPLNWKMNLSAEKRVSPAASPYKHSDASVDLTQNSEDEGDVVLLSDEEINYSIWKAKKGT